MHAQHQFKNNLSLEIVIEQWSFPKKSLTHESFENKKSISISYIIQKLTNLARCLNLNDL